MINCQSCFYHFYYKMICDNTVKQMAIPQYMYNCMITIFIHNIMDLQSISKKHHDIKNVLKTNKKEENIVVPLPR